MSGYGNEGLKYGCNFGVLFPWWNLLFGSASWNREMALQRGSVRKLTGPYTAIVAARFDLIETALRFFSIGRERYAQ
jgi:sterol desaturase/sphingolipid hydroxylase (fatty acid hydroxylase superfamily)